MSEDNSLSVMSTEEVELRDEIIALKSEIDFQETLLEGHKFVLKTLLIRQREIT